MQPLNRAVFLDRDGVITRDVHYCRRVEDMKILSDAPEAIKLLNEHGLKVVVITNQSGVGRGYFSEVTLLRIHDCLARELNKQGARLDGIYYCPHHPNDNCQCRKPRPGLFLQAAQELNIDLAGSFAVGDEERDIEAGHTAGCKTILLTEPGNSRRLTHPPDYAAAGLLEAVRWILERT